MLYDRFKKQSLRLDSLCMAHQLSGIVVQHHGRRHRESAATHLRTLHEVHAVEVCTGRAESGLDAAHRIFGHANQHVERCPSRSVSGKRFAGGEARKRVDGEHALATLTRPGQQRDGPLHESTTEDLV